ncbi:TonB-dependent receptor [Shewanella acanthi]|uniref:TonB-dependent receptor n=1 Tax=Shewanella acanthi TaxID=2864212 RepID=UPI001C65745A|nr:TonB-dependent receptor [Shewanella acanthi]QYJ79382.1 TonB-dependent receptor [Shewanella acanthi]
MTKTNFRHSLLAMAVVSSLYTASPLLYAADSASSGFLTGTAVNMEGVQLSNVKITIVNKDTGLTRTVETSASGAYRFPLLPTGTYNFTAEKDGYLVAKQDNVKVGIGDKTTFDITLGTQQQDMETIAVRGSRMSRIDTTSSEAVTIVDQELLMRVPVARDITAVALLAPGTTQGDTGFGNLASFGGASVGENSFYVNGMNVTNFRNGLGGSDVPFEFYDTFEVKTGGYSAEFGRSTGGVVNATTKRGTNDFEFGASAYFEPSSLRASEKQTYRTQEGIDLYGSKYFDQVASARTIGENNYNVWAGGAILQDKLFYYGLINFQDRVSDLANSNETYQRDAGDLFYSLKLDYYITEDHILEFTAFDSSSDLDSTATDWDPDTGETSGDARPYTLERGGQTYSLKYTGILSDTFTMSAMAGVNKANYSNVLPGSNPIGDNPLIYERFSGKKLGTIPAISTPTVEKDKRTAYRLDFDWYLTDNHTLRFGIDYENLDATNNTSRAGGVAYRYQGCDPAEIEQGDPTSCTIVRKEIYQNEGDFETKSYAYYITDTWNATDTLTFNLGLRNEAFENYNKAGDKFVDVTNQWAPRIGASWDVLGDGETKVFANYGRYFLPVATNTNIRLAGDELYTRQFFEVLSMDENYIPELGQALSAMDVFSDGTLKNTTETVNADLDPMYQDEFILGFQTLLTDDISFGVKGTYRDLKSSLEDVAIDKGFEDYLQREYGSGCTVCDGFHYYVLTNPGKDVTITTDPDGDGPLANQAYTIPAADLGYPEAERNYYSVDLNLNKAWNDNWMLDFTYTWSQSIGNNEGFVRSDNEQSDSGLTTNYDQPGLVDGANGYLPNDRRHQVKVFAAYEIIDNLTAGANFWWRTGRPINAFSVHPTDAYASQYGAEAFFKDGVLAPRGSQGRTPNTWNLDLSLQYVLELQSTDITFRADVFNVFNNDEITEVNEVAEYISYYDADFGGYRGAADPDYLLPTDYQTPRYVRLSASIKF